ncbi:MAG: prkC 30 [Gemmataceae bacterium]|nr:prkC 30 [Gemmataceae bacterium]
MPEPPAAPDLAETAAIPSPAPTDPLAPTLLPPPAPRPAVPTTGAFDEETRALLRRRLQVTHGAVGIATAVVVMMGVLGVPVLPAEAGLGRWVIGLPLLVFGQSLAGWVFLWRRPAAPLGPLRLIEATQIAGVMLACGVARFVSLGAPPADSPDPRYATLLYRFDAVITNYPVVFAIILYGVLIPNTRRRSLVVVALLCLVPVTATVAAAAANPGVFPAFPALLPVTAIPLFMAVVVAVFSASRATTLRRQAFEARRDAQQVGAYTLKRKLGEGGMGEVFLAEHRLLKRPCAVKFVRGELAADPSTAARFEREVRAVTGLSHVNTVRVYDYGRAEDGSFYYVMEYLNGPTLDKLVREHGPLPPGRAVYLLRQLCGALAEAHAAGLVHRDLKPGNIIVAELGGQYDVAKLLDFGLVQDVGSAAAGGHLTQTGVVIGTPAYMCPEQAGGEHGLDGRGDVYSLGAVAFFALAGRPPFEGGSVGKLLAAHLTQPAPAVTEVRKDVPADLAAVVARCLLKDPADRFQSMTELDAALAACGCAADWSAARARMTNNPPMTHQ